MSQPNDLSMEPASQGPRSDFSTSIEKEVTVRFRSDEYAALLELPSACTARLVGYERFGIWIEPTASRAASLGDGSSVRHFFIPWAEILTVIRDHEAARFQTRKEYRGLRPQ